MAFVRKVFERPWNELGIFILLYRFQTYVFILIYIIQNVIYGGFINTLTHFIFNLNAYYWFHLNEFFSYSLPVAFKKGGQALLARRSKYDRQMGLEGNPNPYTVVICPETLPCIMIAKVDVYNPS